MTGRKPWTPDDMITPKRIEIVARQLFPEEDPTQNLCWGLECPICTIQRGAWEARKLQVRAAMFVAFGHKP